MRFPPDDRDHPLVRRFEEFIRAPSFSCLGAKSALSRGQLSVLVARDIRSGQDDLQAYAGLCRLVRAYQAEPKLFRSFAVIYEMPGDLSEAGFERHLWRRVQSLSDRDAGAAQRHDPRVSADPADPDFSLSFGGEGFFVVGLHPGAARDARRFDTPVMVFNLHDQFRRLRAEGRYEKLRAAILARELALSGSVNPMLARFGEVSEARQYSGRAVAGDWVCPFRPPRRGASDAS